VWVFLGGFLGGCTQKKTTRFFGYVPGCLNPEMQPCKHVQQAARKI